MRWMRGKGKEVFGMRLGKKREMRVWGCGKIRTWHLHKISFRLQPII